MTWSSMEFLGTTACLMIMLVILYSWYIATHRTKNYPPAPGIALPIIGHMYLMKSDTRKQFKEWAETYGPAFSLRLGAMSFVVLNGYDIIKEALLKQANNFSGRPRNDLLTLVVPKLTQGIVRSDGSLWKEQRTAALIILRNLGMGRNIIVERIREEVSCFTNALTSRNGEATCIMALTSACVSNVICSMIFGKRFNLDDPKFLRILKVNSEAAELVNAAKVSNFMPYLRHLPFDPFHAKKLIVVAREIMAFSDQMVEEIKQTYDPRNLDNFIVAYIDEMKKKREAGLPTELSENNLARCIDELFSAGTETISATISWCLLYALHYPEKQEKVYQEIIDEVGHNRTPTLVDKPKLKYLNAFIMETQRLASIVPLNVLHKCTADTTIHGYFIPEGTNIIPSLDTVLYDEKIWGDPLNFRPERFLDNQGNLISNEHLIPFSIGRRLCLGESLAKMELYLFISSVFQRFKCLPKDANNIPPMKGIFGIIAEPESYEIRFVDRTFNS